MFSYTVVAVLTNFIFLLSSSCLFIGWFYFPIILVLFNEICEYIEHFLQLTVIFLFFSMHQWFIFQHSAFTKCGFGINFFLQVAYDSISWQWLLDSRLTTIQLQTFQCTTESGMMYPAAEGTIEETTVFWSLRCRTDGLDNNFSVTLCLAQFLFI